MLCYVGVKLVDGSGNTVFLPALLEDIALWFLVTRIIQTTRTVSVPMTRYCVDARGSSASVSV
jgi:hypothetical protein